MGVARKRCWRADWVIDLDIKAFFDSIPHDLVERAVRIIRTSVGPAVHCAVASSPVQRPDGTREERTKGTPQGGVISPLLANLFLHYAFDLWMHRTYPNVQFERYADDAIVHCRSEPQARAVLEAIRGRFEQCGLELHPRRPGSSTARTTTGQGISNTSSSTSSATPFDLGGRRIDGGSIFVSFLPAMSTKAAKAMRKTIREWRLASTRNNQLWRSSRGSSIRWYGGG